MGPQLQSALARVGEAYFRVKEAQAALAAAEQAVVHAVAQEEAARRQAANEIAKGLNHDPTIAITQ